MAIHKEATEYTAEDFSTMMVTNFEAPYNLCQLAHPLLKESGNGNIVFISSAAGVIATPSHSIYAATKGAMNQVTKNLACEGAKDNIRVNAVAPAVTRTPMLEAVEQDPTKKALIDRLLSRTPILVVLESLTRFQH
uniref:Uncharacterized protein n=1 Tax=Davidia involucrata TaxID=16924 RepID=A0A5B6ZN78_DAVIN